MASMRPPPVAGVVKSRTEPPEALRAKPVLVAEAGTLLSQYTMSDPPAERTIPGAKTNLRGAFGSLLRLRSPRSRGLGEGLNNSTQSGVEPSPLVRE